MGTTENNNISNEFEKEADSLVHKAGKKEHKHTKHPHSYDNKLSSEPSYSIEETHKSADESQEKTTKGRLSKLWSTIKNKMGRTAKKEGGEEKEEDNAQETDSEGLTAKQQKQLKQSWPSKIWSVAKKTNKGALIAGAIAIAAGIAVIPFTGAAGGALVAAGVVLGGGSIAKAAKTRYNKHQEKKTTMQRDNRLNNISKKLDNMQDLKSKKTKQNDTKSNDKNTKTKPDTIPNKENEQVMRRSSSEPSLASRANDDQKHLTRSRSKGVPISKTSINISEEGHPSTNKMHDILSKSHLDNFTALKDIKTNDNKSNSTPNQRQHLNQQSRTR